jgi:hypothetical protein
MRNLLTMCVVAAVWLAPAGNGPAAAPPRIGVAGPAFTVDGAPRFLLLVSYFDALRASDAVLDEDFAWLRTHGIDGVRIFPNWWRCQAQKQCGGHPGPDTLVEAPSGRLRPDRMARVRTVLAKAGAHRLIVDLSFARETVAPGPDGARLPADAYERGIAATLEALGDAAPHVLVDLQNEVDHNRVFARAAADDARQLGALARRLHRPGRILFVSAGEGDVEAYTYCGVPGACPADARALDAIAVHDARRADWVERTAAVASAIRAIGARRGVKPVYFQEPQAWQDEAASDRTERFLKAASEAKAGGAAAWTFHTRSAFILRDRSMKSQMAADERAWIEQARARVDAVAR